MWSIQCGSSAFTRVNVTSVYHGPWYCLRQSKWRVTYLVVILKLYVHVNANTFHPSKKCGYSLCWFWMELRLLKCLKGQRSGVPPSLPSFNPQTPPPPSSSFWMHLGWFLLKSAFVMTPRLALFDAREMLFFRTLLGVRNVGLTLIIFCKSADISCTCKLAIEMLGSSYCILHILLLSKFSKSRMLLCFRMMQLI